METAESLEYPSDEDDEVETQRSIIRRSLDEIANDVGIGMREAGLTFALGIAVPGSGASLISMITPMDPNDDDWEKAGTIVCQIITEILGGTKLRCQQIDCILANGTMTAGEIMSDFPS